MKFNIENVTSEILGIVGREEKILSGLTGEEATSTRNKQNRTVKELIGHLIDSASNNHQRIVRLQYNDTLDFPDYTQHNDRWIAIQDYQNEDWHDLVMLWKYFNLHLAHLIRTIHISKLNNVWTDFEGNKVTLQDMIEGYLSHLNLHIGEIHELIK